MTGWLGICMASSPGPTDVPRLTWHRTYGKSGDYTARPFTDLRYAPSFARIMEEAISPRGPHWDWTVQVWNEHRTFAESGDAPDRQAAADAATEAFWRQVERGGLPRTAE